MGTRRSPDFQGCLCKSPYAALITAVTFADSLIQRPLILICEALCFTNEDRKRPGVEAEFWKLLAWLEDGQGDSDHHASARRRATGSRSAESSSQSENAGLHCQ